jgi:retinol dehydrogenase-14
MASKLMTLGATAFALFAVLIGVVLFSPIPTKLGFYRWIAEAKAPELIGFTPAYLYGVPWKYSFEELYKSNLTGQTAIVTGANSGIGYEISLNLARLGAEVTMACRNPTKCEKAAERIRANESTKGKVKSMLIDTSSLSSVKAFAEAYLKANQDQSLDMLFLNAGIGFLDNKPKCLPNSEDGIEMIFATNYVGHHLLYRLLETLLEKSKLARVIQTSSNGSFDTYSYKVATDMETMHRCHGPFNARKAENLSYGQSKLAQIVWSKALTKRLGPDSTIYVNAFNPGATDTAIWDKIIEDSRASQIFRSFVDWMRSNVMWTAGEGALTGLFLGVAVDRLVQDNIRGRYFHPQAIEVTNPSAENEVLQNDLWEFSEELVEEFLPKDAS